MLLILVLSRRPDWAVWIRPGGHQLVVTDVDKPIPLMSMFFRLWEETKVPGENPPTHTESVEFVCIQTPHRKINQGSNDKYCMW